MSSMSANLRSIILDRVRITLSFLRKANIFSESGSNENPLLASFRELQNVVRYSTRLDPSQIVAPFVDLLQLQSLTGPFKLIALDSIYIFIRFDVLINGEVLSFRAVTALINAITSCRYVQTDSAVDELVQLRILQSLHSIIIGDAQSCICEESLWCAMEFCFASLLRNGSNKSALELYHEAELIVLDTMKFILRKRPDGETVAVGSRVLLRLLTYFLKVIDVHSTNLSVIAKTNSSVFQNGNSQRLSSLSTDHLASNGDTLHVSFALSMIHSMLLTGSCNDNSSLNNVFIRSHQFRQMLTDDLGLSILTLLHHRDDSSPPHVLQVCLSIFMTLKTIFGPNFRILMECFTKQVFTKAMVQISELLTNELSQEDKPVVDAQNRDNYSYFSVNDLEVILESLCDLLSDSVFIPSLFASFDCDPTKPDVAFPLLKSICDCTSFVLQSGPENLGQFREIGILVVQLYKHVVNTFGIRLQNMEAFNELLINSDVAKVAAVNVSSNFLSSLFKCGRLAKGILREATRLFCEKSETGFTYLQTTGAFSDPMSPKAVANFLRLTPDIPKDAVGAYLGELGKENAKYQGNDKWFHAQVLTEYVCSFEFEGQGILDCMRIFLSAFRLPGEAQQIDRILVIFSEFCHSSSFEGRSGLLENPEVTYLLSFSIIMLNTDRHNPNIRADRRMTLDQFVRNNTNYGKDVNQTLPLPRSFLESIFHSISDLPIRTQNHDRVSSVTVEVWKDMQLQAIVDPRKSIFISSTYSSEFIDCLVGESGNTNEPKWSDIVKRGSDMTNFISNDMEISPTKIIDHLMNKNTLLFGDPFHLIKCMDGRDWIVDADLVESIGKLMLLVGVSAHYSNFKVVTNRTLLLAQDIGGNNSSEIANDKFTGFERLGKFLVLSNEFLLDSLRVFKGHNLNYFLDVTILLFGGFSGLVNHDFTEHVMNSLHSLKEIVDVDAFDICKIVSIDLVDQMVAFPSTRASLFILLQVIQFNQTRIHCWSIVLYILGALRDLMLLPPQMVLDSEKDILPVQVRSDFEALLLKQDFATVCALMPQSSFNRTPNKYSSSLLSLQGLGEALFGGSVETVDVERPSKEEDEKLFFDQYRQNSVHKNNLSSSRWDCGYEQIFVDNADFPETFSNADVIMHKKKITLEVFRSSMWSGSIFHMVSDTRFMSEFGLRSFVEALMDFTEVMDAHLHDSCGKNDFYLESCKPQMMNNVQAINLKIKSSLAVSRSSVAWFEMLLVEISLRNRDRFGTVWPLLSAHYSRILMGSLTFSYITERRVAGLLKVCTRMMSRDHLLVDVLNLLGRILLTPLSKNSSTTAEMKTRNAFVLLDLFADQISAGVWTLLTLNIEILPRLPLDQWQILFGIISKTGTAQSFAAVKSFESMAWLLHEPRLLSKVPVFCIIGVEPLLLNIKAPTSVSIGAVQLLLLLHSRLEVLIKDDDEDSSSGEVDDNGDTSVLWGSCWFPILKTLAEGVSDPRFEVQKVSLEALFTAVLDRHSAVVPPGVLVDVIDEVLIPVVHNLGINCFALNNLKHDNSTPVNTAISSFLRENWMRVETKERVVHEKEEHDKILNFESNFSSSESVVVQQSVELFEKSVNNLTTLFSRHVKRMSAFPSFDRLWIRVLGLFCHLISESDIDEDESLLVDRSLPKVHSFILDLVGDIAKMNLRTLLTLMLAENIFLLRVGLLSITQDQVSHYHSCLSLSKNIGLFGK